MNRYSIMKMETFEDSRTKTSPFFKMTIRVDVMNVTTAAYVNQQNQDVFGWRFTCPPLYADSNQIKTTFVFDDAWQNIRVIFTVYDLFRSFQASTKYFYQNNIMLRAFVLNEFHLSNFNFMHLSDPNRGLLFESNWIPLIADTEVTTTCNAQFYVWVFHKFKNGKIIETYYKQNLVDRTSFIQLKPSNYDISSRKRFQPSRFYTCRRIGDVQTKLLP
ncbi:hypothetical protein RF11_01945 [Thelohanellus kitauei]|uniref:Uncharacterized protein n=1 Tax=Thelohanellus kitauei TaxID=669202 RepID=A0A0C2MUU0_THEKT|nr:hypothetical protein RF11_01945 [Thelohanellus kitauei]